MRIIHTADWHLGDWLGKIKRDIDFKTRVEAVAQLCEEHAVDVLLIAGDVFSEQASVEEMTRSLQHIDKSFEPFFARGGTILAITGNHDRDTRINMVRVGMSLASPTPSRGLLTRGRMYLENELKLVSLADDAGERVQFVLVPYPTVSRYVRSTDIYRTKEEENRLLNSRLAEWIAKVPLEPSYEPGLPTVLVAHLNVRGSNSYHLYKLDEFDDIVFEPDFLATGWAYVALGHIHKPQLLNNLAHVRYSGSLDRCDFGEINDAKQVVLIDIGPAGLRGEPVCLPIAPTPMHDVILSSPTQDLPRLKNSYPHHETAIVRVLATHDPEGLSRDAITRELRRRFPRLYDLQWVERSVPANPNPSSGVSPRESFRQVVSAFLAARLQDDTDRNEVLALVENYLAEEEQR